MKFIVTFCALCALWGCRVSHAPESEEVALSCSTFEQSKTDVLLQGDEVGVFSNIEGTEKYFLDNTKYMVGSDGRSLSTTPAVYYPDPKQAVTFTAYLPFGGTWDGVVGTFSVPTDQTDRLKEADLCWATASSTPVAAPVALEFQHKLARLLVTANEPIAKIVAPNVFSGGTLDMRTGVFTNTIKSTITTTGTELILPAQTVARLVLTVAGVEYVFKGAISLEIAKTTTANLTLNPSTKTATLSGSSTTNWVSSSNEGNPTQAVANILTMHWPNYVPQGATPDKVVLTINNTDYTVSSEITYADQAFTVPFASSALRYPYTITKIAFTNLPPCTQLLGATIYKSAASTLGIKDPANAVKVDTVYWATGNLIASNSTAGGRGVGGCKIGAPGDGGLYFQFGSLIGWKGGALANGGSGVGLNPYTTNGDKWWGGGGDPGLNIFGTDAMVWPSVMTKPPTAWPANYGSTAGDRTTVVEQYFFNYNVTDYSNPSQDIRGFSEPFTGDAGSGNLGTGRYAVWGVGDPCTYYLGAPWRLPLPGELNALNSAGSGSWVTYGGVTGRWLGTSPGTASSSVFFPASGHRYYSYGSFHDVTTYGHYWSSSVNNATYGYHLHFNSGGVYPQYLNNRSFGFPVRCVSN